MIATPVRAVLILLMLLSAGTEVLADGGSPCPPRTPSLNGPGEVRANESYSISWSSVLDKLTTPADYYVVERSVDPTFGTAVERAQTVRTSASFPPVGDAALKAPVLFHRIAVHSSCPTASLVAIVSNTLAVAFRIECAVPATAPELNVSSVNPPALATYVVSWSNFGSGAPGPGGGYSGLKFRLRRTAPDGTRETVTEGSSASFADLPGVYVYEVRAESSCGTSGPWSPAQRVVVGYSPPQLLLVSEPKPILVVGGPAPADALITRFVVKNGGLLPLSVTASADLSFLSVAPSAFVLAPDGAHELVVRMALTASVPRGGTGFVTVSAGGALLKVPIAFFIAESPAETPVLWDDVDADVNEAGTPFLRRILNPNPSPAAFIAFVRQPWLTVQSLDGQAWERPMAPGEARTVRISIDRSKRRAPMGTEVATITLITAGRPDARSNLVVVDDGPPPAFTVVPGTTGGPAGPSGGAVPATRILYPSLPNALDAKGIGRFTSDLWVMNSDPAKTANLAILLTPVLPRVGPGPGVPFDPPEVRRLDFGLAPGETRRFRNLLSSIYYEGACSVEVRSDATTVSATAVVSNRPLEPAAASRVSLAEGNALAASPKGEYGSEMRPVAPGEGAKNGDSDFVVSGLQFDANRRTNLLLAETSGYETEVQVDLFQSNGQPAQKGGQNVSFTQRVPAGQTVQINFPDLFDEGGTYPSAYFWALATFKSSATDSFGVQRGSVVPLATVVDNRTQDSSLRVGASTRSLNPALTPSSSLGSGREPLAGREALAGLPFDGGPAPLFFPVAHSVGAPLASGKPPVWRTRVTLTNTHATQQRQVELTLVDQTGNATSTNTTVGLSPGGVVSYEDLLVQGFRVPESGRAFGGVRIENSKNPDGTWFSNWQDVDVQTEIYTVDPNAATPPLGEFKTGMEAYPYWHGYSSFQSNLGTVAMEGAETSSRFRTNLILQEVGGAACDVSVAAYLPGSFTPIAQTVVTLRAFDYFSQELFRSVLGLELTELTDVRVVVRQVAGDGVFMAFASKINLATGDPANIFLRPALAGTGR